MQPNFFQPLSKSIEIANDVVAFDNHVFLLFEDHDLGIPTLLWQYQAGPLMAGHTFVRLFREMKRTIRHVTRNKRTKTTGAVMSGSRRLLIPISHDGLRKGYLCVSRSSSNLPFVPADVALLAASSSLGISAVYDTNAAKLLDGVHIEFLHRRTALQQSKTPGLVLEEYLDKCKGVLHPQEEANNGSADKFEFWSYAALANNSRSALYVVANNSPRAKGGYRELMRPIYRHESNQISQVFRTEKPFLENNREKMQNQTSLLNTRSTMIFPITMGGEDCRGVMVFDANGTSCYKQHHLNAVHLLAAQASKPLGRASDRELARRRARDAVTLTSLVTELQGCRNWQQIASTLGRRLQQLDYHCGIISAVDYSKQMIIGESYWSHDRKRRNEWRERCKETQRHFEKNKNDCQVKAVILKFEQLIHDPFIDQAVHPNALKIAPIGPFAIIPIINSKGFVVRTLHVERRDFAPLDTPEIESLKAVCSAAAMIADRLDQTEYNKAVVADMTQRWSQTLQKHFIRREDILEAFADFVVSNGLSGRCRVYRVDGNNQFGICYSGPRLELIPDFQSFKLPPGSRPLVSSLVRKCRLLICIPSKTPKQDSRGSEFPVEYVWPVTQRRRLGKRDEWIEIPFFVDNLLVAKAVLDKSIDYPPPGEQRFENRELQLLSTLGHLTSLAMERTEREANLAYLALLGASARSFIHELKNRLVELERIPHSFVDGGHNVGKRERVIKQVRKQIDQLKVFFSKQHREECVPKPQKRSIKKEFDDAVKLLPIPKSEKDRISYNTSDLQSTIKSLGPPRPLCLMLLQLLQNAVKYGNGRVVVNHRVKKAASIIEVKNFGGSVPPSLVTEVNRVGISHNSSAMGEGLLTAKHLATTQGWSLSIKESSHPTIFVISIPNPSQNSR